MATDVYPEFQCRPLQAGSLPGDTVWAVISCLRNSLSLHSLRPIWYLLRETKIDFRRKTFGTASTSLEHSEVIESSLQSFEQNTCVAKRLRGTKTELK